MKTFYHSASIWLPRPLDEVFPFFSEARNLEQLTPTWLNFEVLTPEPIPMAVGTLIDYRLKVHGIPMRWRSEIAAWDPPHLFVDRQVRGPYRLWHHEHRFAQRDGGTDVMDQVQYAVWGGSLVNRLLIRRDVRAIFAYRTKKLLDMFGENL